MCPSDTRHLPYHNLIFSYNTQLSVDINVPQNNGQNQAAILEASRKWERLPLYFEPNDWCNICHRDSWRDRPQRSSVLPLPYLHTKVGSNLECQLLQFGRPATILAAISKRECVPLILWLMQCSPNYCSPVSQVTAHLHLHVLVPLSSRLE